MRDDVIVRPKVFLGHVECCLIFDFQIKSHSFKFAKHVSIFSNIIFSCWLQMCLEFELKFVTIIVRYKVR